MRPFANATTEEIQQGLFEIAVLLGRVEDVEAAETYESGEDDQLADFQRLYQDLIFWGVPPDKATDWLERAYHAANNEYRDGEEDYD